MELPKEWEALRQKTVDDARYNRIVGITEHISTAVKRCYALHSKPPKELTVDEIAEVIRKHEMGSGLHMLIKQAIGAYQRKQREPETVTFRAARAKDGSCQPRMLRADYRLSGDWEWLDVDGKPQTFTVVLP